MNLRKMARWCAATIALVALFSGEASAQYTPTLTATAAGNSVTIAWTPIVGAQGYELHAGSGPGMSDIAVVRSALPAGFPTRLVVSAPQGRYYLRARAFLGPINGPWSNEAFVSVGFESCVPGVAPVVTATPEGRYVNLHWTAVPGVTGYAIQWSRFSGGTELVEATTTTSHRKLIGMTGTFYVRIVAVSDCGQFASPEVAFTLDGVPIGPRTPTPASGRIPLNHDVLQQGQYLTERFGLYDNGGCNINWLHDLIARLRQLDTRYGYNCKRDVRNPDGTCSQISTDIVAFNWGNQIDEGTHEVYTFDVISNHCNPDGSRATPGWNNTQPGPEYVGLSGWTGNGRY
jgi:hypothetical protein